MMKKYIILLPIIFLFNLNICFANSTEFRKSSEQKKIKKKAIVKNKKKPRKIYINFANDPYTSITNQTEDRGESSVEEKLKPITYTKNLDKSITSNKRSVERRKPRETEDQSKGITNLLQLGYSNSAYRYAGEKYPVQSVDVLWAPSISSTCFTFKCIYSGRFLGGFDLNQNGKNEMALIQLALRFPTEPWGGYLAPEYILRGFLPASSNEINRDKMTYGYGGIFNLASTPELMGSDFVTVIGSLGVRKDVYSSPLIAQKEWSLREALIFDLKWSNTISTMFLFSYIYSSYYDRSEKEGKELIQILKWTVNEWFDVSLVHSNTGSYFAGEGYDKVDTDLVSINDSVLTISLGFTSKF